MSEVILTFQSQLSGVMETVFKAAMFEITRLVEDSFLEEVTRSREQVESLKKRLQLSESRRKDVRRVRCVNCGKTASSTENLVEKNLRTHANKSGGLKQEEIKDDEWNSCDGSTRDDSTNAVQEPTSDSGHSNVDIASHKVYSSQLKEESLHNVQEHPEKWGLCMEGSEEEILHSSDTKCVREDQLQHCSEEWDSELVNQSHNSDPDREAENLQGLQYRSRYSMDELGGFDTSYSGQVLDMTDLDELANSPMKGDGTLSYSTAQSHLPADLGEMGESCRRTHASGVARGRRGPARGAHGRTPAGLLSCGNTGSADLNCLLINEDGYLEDTRAIYQNCGDAQQREHGVLPSSSSVENSEQMYAENPFSHTQMTLTDGLVECSDREERLHTCSQCLIDFPDARSLKAHMHSHRAGSSGRYSCNQCGKSFTQACNLKVHQRIHQGEGLHLCSHCGKGFSSFSDLQKHHCSHAVDKPYCCSLCGNKFSRLWNLKLHRRIHTQEKPHCCTLCDKSFTRADILKVHYRTHTGERPYCCTVCGLSFKRLDHLKSHQRKHRPDLRN